MTVRERGCVLCPVDGDLYVGVGQLDLVEHPSQTHVDDDGLATWGFTLETDRLLQVQQSRVQLQQTAMPPGRAGRVKHQLEALGGWKGVVEWEWEGVRVSMVVWEWECEGVRE